MATSVFSIYDTRTTPYVGYLPTALPKDAIFSKVRPLPKPDKQLFQTLNKTVSQDNWIAATENSFEASIVQLQTGRAAMALGGFDGIDFISTANQRDQYIKDGKIQFFVTSRQIAPKYEVSNIRRWVLDNSMACPHKTQWYVYALGDNPCPS